MSAARGFDTDWRESVGYLLRDATRLMLRVTAARIAEHGITMTQYFLLRQIWEMDALETAGLVVRKRSTTDRRRTHIHVTAKGKNLREPLLEDGKAVLEGMLENCSQRSIDDLRRTLKKIKANLTTMEAETR